MIETLKLFMKIILLILSLLGSSISFAQDREGLSIGAFVMSGNSIYQGVDNVFRVYPSIEYRKGPWELGLANGLKYKVLDGDKIELDMQLSPSFGPYDSGDSSSL